MVIFIPFPHSSALNDQVIVIIFLLFIFLFNLLVRNNSNTKKTRSLVTTVYLPLLPPTGKKVVLFRRHPVRQVALLPASSNKAANSASAWREHTTAGRRDQKCPKMVSRCFDSYVIHLSCVSRETTDARKVFAVF